MTYNDTNTKTIYIVITILLVAICGSGGLCGGVCVALSMLNVEWPNELIYSYLN